MAIILAVEPDKKELEQLTAALSSLHPECEVLAYSDPMLAFQYAYNHPVKSVYAAAAMKRVDGFRLAKMLREISDGIAVYLIGEDETYRRDAKRLTLDGYLIRPVTPEAIRAEENAEEW
mgnify:CR=1 FL=1